MALLCRVGRCRPVNSSRRILLNPYHRTLASRMSFLPREWHILLGEKGQCLWVRRSFTRIVSGSPWGCSSWATFNDYLRVSFHLPLTQLHQEYDRFLIFFNFQLGSVLQKEYCRIIYKLEFINNPYNSLKNTFMLLRLLASFLLTFAPHSIIII